jgi:hypothetical protein
MADVAVVDEPELFAADDHRGMLLRSCRHAVTSVRNGTQV